MRAAKARRRLAEFVRQAWPVLEPGTPLVWNWHLDAVCEHLEAVADGRVRRLLINVPPGHMKSLLVSVFWPAWVWLRNPAWRGLFASYAMDLSIRDSVRCRALITSDWYAGAFAPGWKLSGDQNVKSYFQNDRTGFRLSLSVGGRATGFRGDCVVVDDPLNAREQHSAAARREVLFWWDKVMSSRLSDPRRGARVIIMQRLHEEDLSGHVLRQGGYEHLCLPSEFEPERRSATSIGWSDPRREAGEPLFPGLFPREVLEAARRELGSADYAGQHQQRPAPAEGALFKRAWFRRYDRQDGPPVVLLAAGRPVALAACRVFLTADLATSTRATADYTVIAAWADDRRGNLFLLDMVRGRMEGPDVVPALQASAARWRPQFVGVEATGFQLSVVQEARRRGLPVRALTRHKDKVTRAVAATVRMEAGQVWFPRPDQAGPWLADLEAELLAFPLGRHDDTVDVLADAAEEVTRAALAAAGPPTPLGGGVRVGAPPW